MMEIAPGRVWPEAPHFPIGRAVMSEDVAEQVYPRSISEALGRHERADWGDLDRERRAANDQALLEGQRVESSWTDPYGTKFAIITEADRSYTRVFLAEKL